MSFSAVSELFGRIPRLALVRMGWKRSAVKKCEACGKWRARLMLLWVLSGVIGSVWFSCGLVEYGVWNRREGVIKRSSWDEKAQDLGERFNLSMAQLQALAFLLSSADQRTLSECIMNTLSERRLGNGLSHALNVLFSIGEHSQHQQALVREKIDLQEKCPIPDVDVLEQTQHSLVGQREMPFAFYKDIVPKPKNFLNEEGNENKQTRERASSKTVHYEWFPNILSKIFWWILVGMVVGCKGFALSGELWKKQDQQVKPPSRLQKQQYQPQNSKSGGRWRKKLLFLGVVLGILVSIWIFLSMNANISSRRKETLENMCDERARMLQEQFNVSMNHVNALAILVSTFHHGKIPSAIDQKTFAEFTARTAFERPLMSGVAYALRVPHSQREQFEKQHGWRIKKMETEDQSPVQDEYIPEKLDPSPVQDEYAPVIFSQETVSHIVSVDMMSGKEDRENILRARATGKGVLTSPFPLLKSNHIGVVLTFAVYNADLPPDATQEKRINATEGYLGASFDVPSLVEKLLQQLASKQKIIVNVYDTTNSSAPIRMYGPSTSGTSEMHVSNLDFGDPFRRHEMHCRFKQEPPPPWSAITTSLGVAVIVLLVGHIFHAAINRIEKVEDDYREMRDLKGRAEAADVAKSRFLATVSHEIRTPMNGVLGMLQMLMDTDLDATQLDYAMTAQSSGKVLISLINEVLDQAKIESGRLELEAVPFDVHGVLDNVLPIFSDKSQPKGIEMAVYISDRVPEVLIGDPGRFRQIITNLVGNSVKFTEEGHIFVSVHLVEEVKNSCDVSNKALNQIPERLRSDTDVSRMSLSGFQVVDRWKSWENFKAFKFPSETTNAINLLVTVEDTGVGIPEDAQGRIFMPFMQADSSTSRTYGGTGIGLSISKCLVDLMGGEIGFVSRPGIGSTFAFTAAFQKGSRSSVDMKRHQSDSITSEFRGMRGLVVDGRCIRAEVAKYHLQRLGMHVDIANNQKAAISSIIDSCRSSGSGCLDMVLVDKEAWGEGSGMAFPGPLIELRQNGRLKHPEHLPKMILLATSMSSTEANELTAAGYVDSIIKPLRLNMMSACLRKALGVGNKQQKDKEQLTILQSLLNGKKILVVDDNVVNRKVAEGALKKYGAIVTCADSGKAALEYLKPPHEFDACFMDVQMPEMDGFEATRKIRNMENEVNELIRSGRASAENYGNVSHWHKPILAMTADVFQATHDECVRCGMDDFVSKPFEEEQLYSAVAYFFKPDSKQAGPNL
ncbi:putative histidine kinase response regulator and transcription factor RR-A-type family [Dioscorea sansibarensis]